MSHHIYLVGKPRQGQYAIPVSRSPGQGEGGKKIEGQNFFHLKILEIVKN